MSQIQTPKNLLSKCKVACREYNRVIPVWLPTDEFMRCGKFTVINDLAIAKVVKEISLFDSEKMD